MNILMRKWMKIKGSKCLGRNQKPKIEIKKNKWGILRDEFLAILWIWKQHEWLSVETEPYLPQWVGYISSKLHVWKSEV